MNDNTIFLLQNSFVLCLDSPIPALDSLERKAYRVLDERDMNHDLYGICGSSTNPFNLVHLKKLSSAKINFLLKPIGFDIVSLCDGRSVPILISERPSGRCIGQKDKKQDRWSEDDILKYVVVPIFEILDNLNKLELYHGVLCPKNIFSSFESTGPILLGCPSIALPQVMLPVSFVKLEQAMSHPYGRGPGSISDDLFALGALIVTLLTGCDPSSYYTDDTLFIIERATIGSYMTYVQHLNVGMVLGELLRGLLNDTKDQWSLEDLGLWIRGRRRGFGDTSTIQKAIRPFCFNGAYYFTARALAFAMDQDWDQAYTVILDGTLDIWLRHYLLDKAKVDAVKMAKDMINIYQKQDNIVAHVLIALDKSGIIRFRNFKCMIQGIGTLVAFYANSSDIKQTFSEVINMNVLSYWFLLQGKNISTELVLLDAAYKEIITTLKKQEFGFGFERALYELSPVWPCVSPYFKNDYVSNIRDLLDALNRICSSSHPYRLLDRHVAAYILSKNNSYARIITSNLSFLTFADRLVSLYAEVKIIAALQSFSARNIPFVNLTKVCARFLLPCCEQFHNRKTRQAHIQKLYQIAEHGIIQELLTFIFQLTKELKKDQVHFKNVVVEYQRVNNALVHIQEEIKNRPIQSKINGQKLAKIVASSICLVSLLVLIIMYLT